MTTMDIHDEERSPFAERDNFRDLTAFETAVLHALPANVYTGIRALRALPPRQGIGIGRVGELPRRWEPLPRGAGGRGPMQSTVDRRREANRVARRQRRINRVRGGGRR
jgi:hypothetical protein